MLLVILVSISCEAFSKNNSTISKATLTGKITDKKTGETLAGVTVYITDLKTGGVSDATGIYKIEKRR